MTRDKRTFLEESLDPEDWQEMQALGRRMVDDMLEYTNSLRERPPWRHAPDQVKAHFNQPLPLESQPPEEIYREFLDYVLPYPIGNNHPRFWGWVFGTGTVMGAFAEFLAAGMNTNSGDFDHHSGILVETQVMDWLKELMGFPPGSSGTLTSGCSAANLIGLVVARNAGASYDLRREGVHQSAEPMVLYASEEIHSSVQKAVEILGLGSEALRRIPCDDRFRIDLDLLQESIDRDRREGNLPFCVVGAAGTVNTGAVDDLDGLADLCKSEELWLHIDGAFGAWLKIVPEESQVVKGIERADSLAFDLHKWMYMPYEIGCVLVKHEKKHREAFSLSPAYLEKKGDGRGLSSGVVTWFADYDFQLSRAFRSLKAWMSFKEHGIRKYGRLIKQNIDQARYLGELVESEQELELAVPVDMNVVCFRFVKPGMGGETLNEINKEILLELQENGIAVPSSTRLNGKFYLRVGHTNHRSRREDFNALVDAVLRIGRLLIE
jgi:glutamate/tyrosine decarboxylase-like PLP-dependent enzyme